MGNTEKMNRTRDICMVKYSPDVTMRLYRQLLLQNFEIGMRISGEEIEQKINSLRHEVGLPDQKHNTAVEYFNLLFETKRIKFSDTRKMGYEIISAFYHTEVEYFNEAELKRMAENLCKLMDNYLKNKEREEIHICL